jgi:hypothetical protein
MISAHIVFLCSFTAISYSSNPIRLEPWRGRVIQDPESFTGLDDDMEMKILMQSIDDQLNEVFTPKVNGTNAWKERTPHGIIQILDIVHTGYMSVIAEIPDKPDLYIKYQANCDKVDSPHPLIRDFWYMNEAASADLAPKALFLSPPSLLCDSREGKCAFTMTDDEFANCRTNNGTLRYMIMEKARGVSLHTFRAIHYKKSNGAMGLRNAAIIGAQLIELIQRLHSETAVVHGDIHSPNIMVDYDPVAGRMGLKLIDFGMAFRLSYSVEDEGIERKGCYFHQLCTIWQMYGYPWTARDDILKAIHTVAQIMQPFEYFEMEKRILASGWETMEKWKLSENWFFTDFHDPVDAVKNVHFDVKIQLYSVLDEIQDTVRSIPMHGDIPYDTLIELMMKCVNLTRSLTSSPIVIS